MADLSFRRPIWRKMWLILLAFAIGTLAVVGIMSPNLTRQISGSLQAGQVAGTDVLAPFNITYTSDVLTAQRQEAAMRSVLPVYTLPDPSVARQQMERLRSALAYITSIRADPYASPQQKVQDLLMMENVHLSQELTARLVDLSETRWQAVQQETISVLEEVMRRRIQTETLGDAQASLPTLVSLAMPEGQAEIVVALASAFVTPNSVQSDTLTEAARQKARDAVGSVTRVFVAGETVVSRGQVLTDADIEALERLGLTQPKIGLWDWFSAAALVALLLVFFVFYLRRSAGAVKDTQNIILTALLFLLFLFSARLTIGGNTLLPFAFPLAAYGLIVAVMFGTEMAMVTSLILAILAAYNLANTLEVTLFFIIGSLFGVLALGRAQRVGSFFLAGLAIAASGIVIILAYHLPLETGEWMELGVMLGAALFSGLASASLTILLELSVAQFFGVATPMQLMELTRPDHPLLRLILQNAPGTYQHSLQLANLAEQAAERVGADPLLTRVGALYHDAGKALNPVFFIENQVPGMLNPHDDLDPQTSAVTIIRHVRDGLELAHKYRLPRRIDDFINEHHGTMITRYQYVKAVEASGGDESKVNKENFRYPGHRPRSKETAILMLADGSEARVRAEVPKDEQELRQLIKGVIDNRLSLGQLDLTDLTLNDLNEILESFTATLRGVYHPRVKYPVLEAPPAPAGDDELEQKATTALLPAEASNPENPSPSASAAEQTKPLPQLNSRDSVSLSESNPTAP